MVVKMLIVHLWVLSAAVQTTQASPGLSVSPNVTATCGQSVTLHCEVSSDQDDMIVKHLSWINNTTALCSVENDNLTDEHPTRDVECFYADKSLNVTFLQPSPQQSRVVDEYMCKLRSTHGFVTKRTWVQFKECIERVEDTSIAEVRKCTFEGVLPDRELHWSNGHTRLTEKNAMFETRESVDKECCLTIISSLQVKNHTVAYTCSLWNSKTKKYTLSHTFPPSAEQIDPMGRSGVLGPQWSIGNCLIISVLLMSL